MTDQRTDDTGIGLSRGLDGEPLAPTDVGVPEQPPMDDAAGGPSVADPDDAADPGDGG